MKRALALVLFAALAWQAPAICQAQSVGKVIKKVAPEFPPEATRKKVKEGVLKARLEVDAAGSVTAVEVVEATPPKASVFNDAAITALKQWKFEPSGKSETYEMKMVFTEE